MLNNKLNPILVKFSKTKKTGKFMGLNTVNYIFVPVQKDWFTPIFNIDTKTLYNYSPRLKKEVEQYILYGRTGKFFETIGKRFMKYYGNGMFRYVSEIKVIPHGNYELLFTTIDVLTSLQIQPEAIIADPVRIIYSHNYLKKYHWFRKNTEDKTRDSVDKLMNLWGRPITYWSNNLPLISYNVTTPYGKVKFLSPQSECGVKSKKNIITLDDLLNGFLKNPSVVDECKISYYTGDEIIYINGAVYYKHGLTGKVDVLNENLKFETEIIDSINEVKELLKQQLPVYYEAFKKNNKYREFNYDYDYFVSKLGLPVGKCVEVNGKYIFPIIILKNPDEIESYSFSLNSYIKFNLPKNELMKRLVLVILPKKDFDKIKVICDFYSIFI